MMASPNSAISDSDRSMYTLFLDVGADHICKRVRLPAHLTVMPKG